MAHKPLTARLVRTIVASMRELEHLEREPPACVTLPDGRKIMVHVLDAKPKAG